MKMLFQTMLSLTFLVTTSLCAEWAVITVPVADMTFREPSELAVAASTSAEELVAALPLSIEHQTYHCPRGYQGLYNEQVEIVTRKDGQVLCRIPTLYYDQDPGGGLEQCYWVLEKNLTPLSQLAGIVIDAIPSSDAAKKTVTLTLPYTDTEVGQTYSLGTKFIRQEAEDTDITYCLVVPNFKTNSVRMIHVPKGHCLPQLARTLPESQQLFMLLIKNLLTSCPPDKVIPFSWGGNSLCHWYANKPAQCVDVSYLDQTAGIWTRDEIEQPHSGYDASSFILRMAQIAGLPYPFKTTLIASQHLTALQPDELLKNGDLLWVPGGLFVINTEENTLIGARGYALGYGKVVEQPLDKVLYKVHSIEELVALHRQNASLQLLKANGEIYRKVDSFRLLKLASCAEKNSVIFKQDQAVA
ncbi:hypothetical protein JW872_01415 [Candidatus Babeliales bacterium]|nr:hypothetical protein [Candidatus Babeliales bacterium]